ncbi:LuxR family transcriptional regulator [Rhizobium helianthi]|uniref:LuxR family transcriptional regulator n=1 Tax=Rhizobium helianthi TaxID=1132695 RepID=A0ABW4LZ71_9HYPH
MIPEGSAQATHLMFDYIVSMKTAQSSSEVLGHLRDLSTTLGFDSFAVSGIPLANENIAPYVLLSGWRQDWFDHYVAENYVHIDPVIRQAKLSDEAFVWSEVIAGQQLGPRARKLMNEAADVGMRDGFCVPLHLSGGFQALVTFSGQSVDLPIGLQSVLQIIAIYAHNRLRFFMPAIRPDRQRHAASITQHELDVIRWCAEGKTNWEIGAILGRSEKTVQHELHNAQLKLSCVNRAQLVAEAFRAGLIR